MIPTPAECNWNSPRPWSDLERQVSDLVAGALTRCDQRGIYGPPPINPPSNASLMLMGAA